MLGQSLGHYRIEESLGSGGMGTVYRARDDRLERPVAIKLLSDPSLSDDEAHAKILAEARAASALNHPNICTIYEVGEARSHVFLVMEYIQGRPLSTLIPADGLAPDMVLRYGADIAAALEHAHEHGILHRDLKSSNVILTTEGRAKVLDFGLAQRVPTSTPEQQTQSDTAVVAGHIGGTVAYLAPEVLLGQRASVQSDIWALGVLLSEMACGKLPFQGRNVFELTAEILRTPAPAPATVPPALRMVIQRCLAKDAGQRYRRAGEVRAALEAISSDVVIDRSSVATAAPGVTRRRRLLVGLAAGAVAIAAVAVWQGLPGSRVEPGRLTMLLSTEQSIIDPVLSPDGKMIAYAQDDASGQRDLIVARVAGGGRIRLTNDETRESAPSFSPDGERLAFTRSPAGGPAEIRIIPTLGGHAVLVLSRAAQPVWSPDGQRLAFLHRPRTDQPLVLATAARDGSGVRTIFAADRANAFIRYPTWSPDGVHIAFVRGAGGTAGEIWTVPAAGGTPRRLSNDPPGVFSDRPVFTADGRSLLYVTNRGGAVNLWLLPIEGGTPVRVTTGPGPDSSPSIAANGVICFLNAKTRATLVAWNPGTGAVETLFTHVPYIWAPAISHDGRHIAFSRGESDGSWHIWAIARGDPEARQITSGEHGEIYPRFTPDGESILFQTWNGPRRIWRAPLRGGPSVPVTPEYGPDEAFADVSRDGRLVFVRTDDGTEYSYVSDANGATARRLTSSPSTVPRWSPDGQWVAFATDRGYMGGISLIRPDGTGERRLTDRGGWPVWWPDGRRIGYLVSGVDGNQEIHVVDVGTGASSRLTGLTFVGTNYPFDVSRDGATIVTSNAVRLSDEVWLLER